MFKSVSRRTPFLLFPSHPPLPPSFCFPSYCDLSFSFFTLSLSFVYIISGLFSHFILSRSFFLSILSPLLSSCLGQLSLSRLTFNTPLLILFSHFIASFRLFYEIYTKSNILAPQWYQLTAKATSNEPLGSLHLKLSKEDGKVAATGTLSSLFPFIIIFY